MLPSETMIWQPEFTDKTLSRKPGAVQFDNTQERRDGRVIRHTSSDFERAKSCVDNILKPFTFIAHSLIGVDSLISVDNATVVPCTGTHFDRCVFHLARERHKCRAFLLNTWQLRGLSKTNPDLHVFRAFRKRCGAHGRGDMLQRSLDRLVDNLLALFCINFYAGFVDDVAD
ncbi:hypothetical protein EIZ92_13295 [Escherichia coli]|nr:hypothetical protein [Escherichia coli]